MTDKLNFTQAIQNANFAKCVCDGKTRIDIPGTILIGSLVFFRAQQVVIRIPTLQLV